MALGYRTLSRKSFQRKALLRDLITDLILNGRIETTLAKAKELKRLADKMVTLGKKGDLAAIRQAAKLIRFELATEVNEDGEVVKEQYAIQKLFKEIAPKFSDRNGGYTRVLKTGPRRGDSAPMALIEFVA
jgi:large subunit ribosomal protein L17